MTKFLVNFIILTAISAPYIPARGAAPVSGNVGLVFDLTEKVGEPADLVLGFKIAAEKLKARGIHLAYKTFDSKDDALGTRNAMRSLLRESPDFIVAEVNSSKAYVAAEMAESAKRFLLTPLASSPGITGGKKYIYRASYSDNFQGAKLADFVIDTLEDKRAAILWDGGQLYSKTLMTAFKAQYQARGGQVIAEERVATKTSDFKAELERISQAGAKTVFAPVYEDMAARILNQAGRLKLSIKQFLGGDGWYPRHIFSDLINPRQFPFSLYWVVQFEPNLKDPAVVATIAEIEKKAGRKIDGAIAAGYDMAMFLGQILKTLGRAPKSQEEVLQTVAKLPKYRGLSADFEFGGGHETAKSIYIHTMSQNESVLYKELKP